MVNGELGQDDIPSQRRRDLAKQSYLAHPVMVGGLPSSAERTRKI